MKSGVLLFLLHGLLLISGGAFAQTIQWIPAGNGVPDSVLLSPLLAQGETIAGLDQAGGRIYRLSNRDGDWAGARVSGLPAAGRALISVGVDSLIASISGPVAPVRSTDGGNTWAPLDIPLMDSEIVFSLIETSTGVLLAGTHYGSQAQLGRIYRSTDRGDTWALISTGAGWGGTWRFIQTPNGLLFADHHGGPEGGDSGVSRSSDDGVSWTWIYEESVSDITTTSDGSVLALLFGDLARTVDDGQTWEVIATLPTCQSAIEAHNEVVFAYSLVPGCGLSVSLNGGEMWSVAEDVGKEDVWDVVWDIDNYVYVTGRGGIYRSVEPVVVAHESNTAPNGVALGVPQPNPARDITTLPFTLSEAGVVGLAVYNMSGRRIAEWAPKPYPAGTHRLEWNVSGFSSGVYGLVLRTGETILTRRIVVIH